MKILLHIVLIALLTVLTQTGGLIYLIALLLVRKKTRGRYVKRILIFTTLYLLATFLIIPNIAPFFGREKIRETENLRAHSFFYKLANRNYVKPELNKAAARIAAEFERQHRGIQMVYLDANFPFIDKFPLLPHLSHNDGKKMDVSFIYQDPNGQLTNAKKSLSGYGVYEGPAEGEFDQTAACKQKGYWQYDFPKYLTFGKINKELGLSEKATRELVITILNQDEIGKLFIEPHLKSRLQLNNNKVRFHGCRAVRHDDHIHFQLK